MHSEPSPVPAAPSHVTVIGAGTMGCGIAAGFLAHGVEVALLARDASRFEAIANQTRSLAASVRTSTPHGGLTLATLESTDAWDHTALVIETVKEDLALKQGLFAQLDARVPRATPIGSNSSSHAISRVAQGLGTRSRMFNMHYFMPAHRVPLVEVVLGVDSDPALAQRVCAMFAATGKKPVLVKRDIPGFLANRIQHALMREVLTLIDSGIASPEDIDMAVRYSFGFRYAAIGPVLQKEMSGWDTSLLASAEIYPSLSNTTEVPECLKRLVAENKLGMKTGEGFVAWTPESAAAMRAAYDERLAAALKLLA
ncbi:MAG: 3-hydroxyacyl-CoA dehydrogenase NAD-binding domain-containing protein [Burkholderiaceae bacterium]